MQRIGAVMVGMTLRDYVTAAERNEREQAANARLARLEAEQGRKVAAAQAEEARLVVELGRPEYLYVKNAKRKVAKYARWHKAVR